MSKRGRGDILTGGTGDVNPQLLHASVALLGSGFTVYDWHMPVLRQGTIAGKAQVVELLRLYWSMSHPDIHNIELPGSWQNEVRAGLKWGAKPTTIPPLGDPSVLYRRAIFHEVIIGGLYPADTGYINGIFDRQETEVDFTDGAGHGLLVFAEYLYLYIQHFANLYEKQIEATILYRFKNIGALEFLTGLSFQQV